MGHNKYHALTGEMHCGLNESSLDHRKGEKMPKISGRSKKTAEDGEML